MNIMRGNNLCIIPARGGSKRIPRKNIKNFLGKPIIAYSIEAAKNSGLFSEVMVSTDDEEIAIVAQSYGAQVPFFRSLNNSGDFATTLDVIKEVVNMYKDREKMFDAVCCLYPTAPFVTADRLKESFSMFFEQKFDSLFPVMQFSFPIQRSIKINDNKSRFFFPDYVNSRSQDLEKSYHDAGQFYWLDNKLLTTGHSIMTDNTGAFIINEMEGQDIDNETDWKLAEMKYELLQNLK